MDCTTGMRSKPWRLAFLAQPEEVAALRRSLRTPLQLWGLYESIEDAQLCVSELVANVINHVGPGTPATLAVSLSGTRLRIEVHDPDTRGLPRLKDAHADSVDGRGMTIVDAVAERWGVQLYADRKVIWCELSTGLTPSTEQVHAQVAAGETQQAAATRRRSPSTSTRQPEAHAEDPT